MGGRTCHGLVLGPRYLRAQFEKHLNIPHPVLLGHAGFPARPKKRKLPAPAFKFEWTEKLGPKYITFGFAALDFYKEGITVRLINLRGKERHKFTIP